MIILIIDLTLKSTKTTLHDHIDDWFDPKINKIQHVDNLKKIFILFYVILYQKVFDIISIRC